MTFPVDLAIGAYARLGGGGLYPLRLHKDGEVALGAPVPALADASWGIAHGDGYAFVEEGDAGRITFTDRTFAVTERLDSGGAAPCHIASTPDGRGIAVANYQDGRVALLRPGCDAIVHRADGAGRDPDRQDGPHAHWVGFDAAGRLVYVDLGSDRVRALPVADGGFGDPLTLYRAPAGSGPRHIAWHPRLPVAYLVSELAATLTVIDGVSTDRWHARAIVPTLPPGEPAGTLGGAIAIDRAGERLYVTNRGHDSVVVFAVDADGGVAYRDVRPSGGASPRHLLLLEAERLLVVANEEGGSVAILSLADDGTFAATEPWIVAVPGAVFAIRTDREPV